VIGANGIADENEEEAELPVHQPMKMLVFDKFVVYCP
jgi:hypothetical protein